MTGLSCDWSENNHLSSIFDRTTSCVRNTARARSNMVTRERVVSLRVDTVCELHIGLYMHGQYGVGVSYYTIRAHLFQLC